METQRQSNICGEKTPVATPYCGCCANAVGKCSYIAALQTFSTLSIKSTCTAERAFSATTLQKTYLRNTMTDERLTKLAFIGPETASHQPVCSALRNTNKPAIRPIVGLC